jgi:hypothetical protein
MAATQGNCFICGKTLGKTAMKNHVLREHAESGEPSYLLKAEGAYDKDYWLLFSFSKSATLRSLDAFLREIWCECCGHLSAFSHGRQHVSKSTKISALPVLDPLVYEYDFGSASVIVLTVLAEISHAKQRGDFRLLARNIPPELKCGRCGSAATVFNSWESEWLCGACAESEDGLALLPVTNSPRCGECSYVGKSDIWTFDPQSIAPAQAKRRSK